jgi:hypothetical protein
MNRRACLGAIGAIGATGFGLACPRLAAQPADASATGLRSLLVLDFELIDEQHNPAPMAAQEVRLRNATAQIQRELAERKLYRVVDPAPSAALQRELRSQQEYLHRCGYCAQDLGKQVGVELVMTTWVQKVSELILNVNVEIHDVKTGKVVLTKSVDMRGNTDESWTRAVRYLVRDIAEKRERNSRYGL